MWFSMPKGCGGITVERQEFTVEATDEKGVNYFRAPEHFAPRILAIPGFALADQPLNANVDDLPRADPLRDDAIAILTAELSALRLEQQNARTDLAAAHAELTASGHANQRLAQKLTEANSRIRALEEKLDDEGIDYSAIDAEAPELVG